MPLATTKEVVDFLRTAAADLEEADLLIAAERVRESQARCDRRYIPVFEEIGESEAVAKIREVLGDGCVHFSISKTISAWGTSKPEAKYAIWDGNKHHYGNTRKAAVNALIADRTPKPETPFEGEPVEATDPVPPPTPEQVAAYKTDVPF